MGKIILEEQVGASTPASNKVAVYPKAGGGIYKKADDGVENLLATKTYVDTVASGHDEHNEMLGLTIGDDHTQYMLVDGTRAFSGVVSGITPTVDAHLATKAYIDTVASGQDDHSELNGLTVGDDHTQYILVDGSRAFTGDIQANASGTLDIGSAALPFKDLYMTGASLYMEGTKVLSMSGGSVTLGGSRIEIRDGKELRFYDDDNSAYIGLKAAAVASTVIWTLPSVGGTGLTLIDDGLGALVMGGHDDLNGFLTTEHFTEASIDHGSIAGLTDDDHPQYLTTTNFTVYSGTLQTDIDAKLKIDGTDAFTGNVQANASGTLDIGAVATPFNDIFAETINLQLGNAPATATSAGTMGTIAWDANYIYVCVNTNVWNRTAISGSW